MADGRIFSLGAETKICSKCGEQKLRSDFNKERGKERAYCKECHRAAVKKWVETNGPARREYAQKWASTNRDKTRAYSRAAYRRMTPEQISAKRQYNKRRHLERKYGISKDEWQRMFNAQGGVCALCRIPGRTGKHGKLAVDHCHETGKVRGLLCASCNVSIGILGDTTERLERVVRYMRCEPVD